MGDFEATRTLATRPRFTIIEARDKKLKLQVILKKCEYSTEAEAEFFIRSFLWKTKNKLYSHPPLSIRAEADRTTGKKYIIFEWQQGKSMDQEIEVDRELQLASGNAGYEKREIIHMNASTGESVERAKCLSLGRKVVIKAFRHMDLIEINPCLEEALALAKCTHPNICEFLDFRLFQNESGGLCAYIVMERLGQDLGSEIRKRKSARQPYTEKELLNILIDVTAGLLYAKSMNIAHRDIKPANILRGPQGLKLADFGSVWQKGQYSETANAKGTVPYMSPEAYITMNSSGLLQRPFESDIFSLGVTMLHLATLELPLRSAIQSEQEVLLRRAVSGLSYSEEFKQLFTTMLSFDPRNRQTLEYIRESAMRILRTESSSKSSQEPIPAGASPQGFSEPTAPKSRESPIELREQASKFSQQAKSKFTEKQYTEAADLCSAADAIYSRLFPDDKDTALNLNNWGKSLYFLNNDEEASRKIAAADAIYSRFFPSDKDTAINLKNWGNILQWMDNYEESVQKYAAADAIFSRFFPNDKDTAENLMNWGKSLYFMNNYEEAARKLAAADAILSRFFPNDKDTADNLKNWGASLGEMENYEEAARKHAAADAIFSRFYPNDKDTANNLKGWGVSLYYMNNYEEAVRKFTAADAILSRFYPNDESTAYNLNSWGVSLREMNNYEESAQKHASADAIYSRLFPNDKDTADNLKNWGMSLQWMNSYEEAVLKHAAADAIYSRLFPNDKNAAKNLNRWGLSLYLMKNYEEAARKFSAADAIYSRFYPNDKDNANNLSNWGASLYFLNNYEEAVRKYAAADTILSRLFPNDKDITDNLKNWGFSLKKMGQREEAIQKFQAAAGKYTSLGLIDDARKCDNQLASLR